MQEFLDNGETDKLVHKIKEIQDNQFTGDIYYFEFKKIVKKSVLPNGICILDEDELKEAYNKLKISKKDYDIAYSEAHKLINLLENKGNELHKFTDKYLKMFYEE